jgi:hypothetical protein
MSRFTLRLTSGIRLKDKVRFIKLPDLFHDNFVLSWFSVTKLAGDKMKNILQSVKSVLQTIMRAIAVI